MGTVVGRKALPLAEFLIELKKAVEEAKEKGKNYFSHEEIKDFEKRYDEIIEKANIETPEVPMQ